MLTMTNAASEAWDHATVSPRVSSAPACHTPTAERAIPTEDLDIWQHALESVTSPEGSTTTYHYDAGGHRDLITLPNGSEEARTWTSGHLDLVELPFGVTLDYTRDAAFRITSRTGTDGSELEFTYGPMDRVETATDETGTVTHEYDAVCRQTGVLL